MRLVVSRLLSAVVLASAFVAGAARANQADDQYAVAAGHYAARRWELAASEFGAFLGGHPADARAASARFFAGEALMQLGRYVPAQQEFAALVAKFPHHKYYRQALFRSGEAALLAGNHEAARKPLTTLTEKYPDDELNAYALVYLGQIDLKARRSAEAADRFAAALKKFPKGPLTAAALLGQGRALDQQGKTDDAVRALEKLAAMSGSPLAGEAQFQLGAVQNSAGRNSAAAATLSAFRAKSTNAALKDKARLGEGYALYKLGRYREAGELLTPLVEHKSLGVEAGYWLGLAQKGQSQHASAVATLLTAANHAAKHPLEPAILFHLGDALRTTGKLDDAGNQFDRVLASWPKCAWSDDATLGKIHIALAKRNFATAVALAAPFETRFPKSPLKLDVEIAEATALAGLGNHSEAAALLSALDAKPLTGEQRIACDAARAESLLKLSKLDEAKKTLAALRKKAPTSPALSAPALALAEAAYQSGDRATAADLFGLLAKVGSTPQYRARGLSGLGWNQYQQGDMAASATTFERLLKDYPSDPLAAEAALMQGQALEHLQKFDAARAMYQLVWEKYPRSAQVPQALLAAAHHYEQQNRGADATALYERLIKQYPTSADIDQAIYRLALVKSGDKRPDEAKVLLERIHMEFRGSKFWAEATRRLGDRALADQEFALAEKLAAELIERRPDGQTLAAALYVQAAALGRQGRWADAAPLLERAKKAEPASPHALAARRLLAEAIYKQGNHTQTVHELTRLAAEEPASGRTWIGVITLRRAQSLAQLHRWDEALEAVNSIKTADPDFDEQHEADYLAGRCLAAKANLEGAREAYARVIASPKAAKSETAAMAQWMIGESYFHQEKYREALAEYLRVEILYAYPQWQAAALLQAGKCQEALGQWSDASGTYARLLKLYSDTEFVSEAQKRLSAAENHVTNREAKEKKL